MVLFAMETKIIYTLLPTASFRRLHTRSSLFLFERRVAQADFATRAQIAILFANSRLHGVSVPVQYSRTL